MLIVPSLMLNKSIAFQIDLNGIHLAKTCHMHNLAQIFTKRFLRSKVNDSMVNFSVEIFTESFVQSNTVFALNSSLISV